MWPSLRERSPAVVGGPRRRRAAVRSSPERPIFVISPRIPITCNRVWQGGLIERCFADAREKRIALFKCMSSLPAEGFYARLGFRRIGPTDFVLPGDIRLAAVAMERDLG